MCGVIEPGLQSTCPRSISSRLVPRSRQPTLSPARPWSRILRNISTPVTTVVVGVVDADDLDGVAGLDDALLDAPGRDGAAAGDREDVLDGHQERLVELAHGLGDVVVERVGEVEDLLLVGLVAFQRLQRRADDERDVVAGEVVLGEQLADLDLDQLEQLLVVDHVGLVEEHDDVGDADLAGEQDVLARLGHRAVGGGDDEDRAVHLRGAGDHVLDVVGVPGAVDVRVVAVVGLVLDVRGGDRDPALLLLGSVVDLLEAPGLGAPLLRQHVVMAAVSVVLPWSM